MESVKHYFSVYCFSSDRVRGVTNAAELFNEILRPMLPWFDIRLVDSNRPTMRGGMGDSEYLIGGVPVLFTRLLAADSMVCFVDRSEDHEKYRSNRVYIERFCRVLDGASRDDEGQLKGVPK